MLHWRGLVNTALDLLGSFKGVKHFDHTKGCGIPKENVRLAVNDGM
jgi:hypothetical protein